MFYPQSLSVKSGMGDFVNSAFRCYSNSCTKGIAAKGIGTKVSSQNVSDLTGLAYKRYRIGYKRHRTCRIQKVSGTNGTVSYTKGIGNKSYKGTKGIGSSQNIPNFSVMWWLSSSVVDPNRLCSDRDPGSHVHSDPDPAPASNRIRINLDPDMMN